MSDKKEEIKNFEMELMTDEEYKEYKKNKENTFRYSFPRTTKKKKITEEIKPKLTQREKLNKRFNVIMSDEEWENINRGSV